VLTRVARMTKTAMHNPAGGQSAQLCLKPGFQLGTHQERPYLVRRLNWKQASK
jgi:hypothetical protein